MNKSKLCALISSIMKNITALIYGSYRSDRKGIRAALYMEKMLKERDHQVHIIDALTENLPMLDRMFKEYKAGEAPENMVKLSGWLRDADGFVIVTGEYNHGLQPGLKNFLDHFQKEYYFKPSGIVSYSGGRFGGQIAAMNMRITMAELGSVTIPVIHSIPKVQDAFDEEGNPQEEYLDKATKKFLDEYEWYLEALKLQRDKGNPY